MHLRCIGIVSHIALGKECQKAGPSGILTLLVMTRSPLLHNRLEEVTQTQMLKNQCENLGQLNKYAPVSMQAPPAYALPPMFAHKNSFNASYRIESHSPAFMLTKMTFG